MNKPIFSLKIKIIVFFINLLTLVIIGFFQFKYQHDEIKDSFYYNIENIIKKEFSNKISTTKGVITSFSSYYHSSVHMNSSSFTTFSKDLLTNYDYMNSVAFASVVKKDEREAFTEMMQDSGFFNFEIKSYDRALQKFVKEPQKEMYAPIIYIEPASFKYTRYYGFDIYNDKLYNNSFLIAAKQNSVQIRDRVQNEKKEFLYLFIKPTYSGLIEDENLLKRVNGFFIIDIDIHKILKDIKDKFPQYKIDLIDKNSYEKLVRNSFFENHSLLNDLVYYSNVEEFSNSFFYIKKKLKFEDFNLKTFLMIMALVVIIQILYVLVWQKDRFAKNKLNYKASHDELTKLTNRSFFKQTFEKKIEDSDEEKNAAILFIDLDRFKEINDSFGHKFGDEVLVEVANRFKKVMRSSDTICRYGGDEFIILIDDIKDYTDVLEVVKKVMATTNEPINHNSQKIYLTVSIGISLYPNDGLSVDDLLKNADSALYKAKDEGRNTYRLYTEDMTLEVMQRIVLENKIRDAIIDDEFIVYYQPQYDARTNKLIGMEALVRWQDKEQGLIPPDMFIPIAEETGLIVQLDRLTMKKAIRDFSNWYKQGFNPGCLSLNLSMMQLKSENFISVLKESLVQNNYASSNIELEITESQIMQNPQESIEKLKELNSYGIKLSVDDFGTGYSSLSYLKKLPINKLKIDRAFVKDLPNDEEDIAISKSIIALAKNLKLDVIAEGVETQEQIDFLVKNGCHKIQGYFYSRPKSASEIEELLKTSKS